MNSRKKQIILTLNPPNYKWDVQGKTYKFKKKNSKAYPPSTTQTKEKL